jgi:hypothetical protein
LLGIQCPGFKAAPLALGNVVTVSCGSQHSVALTQEGRVQCRGSNEVGQCKPPLDLESAVAVSGGGFLPAAVTADGKVVCWGGYSAQQKCKSLELDNIICSRLW